MAKRKQITVWSRSKSGASLRVDSYKYKIISSKVVGKKKYSNGYMYKYKIIYKER